MNEEILNNKINYKEEIVNLRIMFPMIYLLLALALAPIEHSLIESWKYIQENPINASMSIFLFSFAIPRAGFIVNSSPMTKFQQKIVWLMTLMAFIVAFYIVK